ncbi:MAG: response regulator [Arcobacteraceae bacterium]|nr:response regulator [Arcobacteraceae bacterium]
MNLKQIVNCQTKSKNIFNPLNYKVLIVEDSTTTNKIISQYFLHKKYQIISVFSLAEAYEILNTDITIDYVMLDINLPDGNGYELITNIPHHHTKFFILTTENDSALMEHSYKNGVIDFIVKDKYFIHKLQQLSTTIEQLENNKEKTILIVDDSLLFQQELKDLLTNRHYNVELANNAENALFILQHKQVDLMFLDAELEQSYGIEFLQHHHHFILNRKKVPVLILSSNMTSVVIRDALKAGAVDVLKKPYIIEEIILKSDLWIDYRKKEQEILCATQLLQEYKNTVDESAIVSKTDVHGKITYVNNYFCQLSGYSESELLGKPHNIVRHPDMPKEAFTQMWKTIKEERQTWRGKVKNKKKDGTFYIVDAVIKPIIDVNGDIVEFIGLRTDITELENYKEMLSNKLDDTNKSLSENINYTKQYEEALDMFNLILKTDTQDNITYANESFCKISGYCLEELIGKECSILRHHNHTLNNDSEKLKDALSKNQHLTMTFTNIAKDKSLYFVETIAYPIVNLEGKVIEHLHLMYDISELTNLHQEIEDTQREIVYKMGEIGESRSKETGHHVKRVALYSKLLGELAGLSEEEVELLFIASPMHDIGKISIPDNILTKSGKLDENEFKIIQSHSEIGYEILKNSSRPILKTAAIVSYEHHERWDGKGYPRGLKKEEIHIFGRITAIADVFDALGSDRCYKEAWSLDKILELFKEEKGKQFDPLLMELFLNNLDKFLEIRDNLKDD